MRKYKLVLPESIAKEKARLAELKKKKKAKEAEKRAEKRKREQLKKKERLKKLKQKEKEKEREKRRKEKEKQKRHEAALKRKKKRDNAWHRKRYKEEKQAYFQEHRSEIISEKCKKAYIRRLKKKAYSKEYYENRRSSACIERMQLKAEKERIKKELEKKAKKNKADKRYRAKLRRKRLQNEYGKKYYLEHKGKAAHERRILTNDIPGTFCIAKAANNKIKNILCRKKWWNDVMEKWNELVENNHKDVMCPVREYINHHTSINLVRDVNTEILLLKKINPEIEDNGSVFRDENGKIVNVKTDDDEWAIVLKEPWYKEETFIVNSMNPSTERKTAKWIGENLLETGLSQDNFKKVLIWNNLILIDGDNDFDICRAKTVQTANNLYMSLFNKYSNTEYIYFIGELDSTQYDKWRKKITEKTGWDQKRVRTIIKSKSSYKRVPDGSNSKVIPTKSRLIKSTSGKSSGKR